LFPYDANGAISTIQYNLLNLAQIVQFTAGHQNRYSYGANGQKLTATSYTLNTAITVPQGTISALPSNPADYIKVTTDYIGNKIYQNSSLKQIQTPEGYCQNGVYYYYLKDHLGNTRVVINSSGTIVEKSHYYPFGMRFYPESTSNSSALAFRYNGKEFESMNGLNRYDYGARFYDPALGRWHRPDPLAEKWRRMSPYNYAANNPMRFIDPDGMGMTDILDKDKKLIQHIEDGSNAVFQLTGNSRSEEYFQFTGYDEKQGGENKVNTDSAIKGAQDYTRENYTSDIDANGKCTQTYCNYGTMNIAKTYESAVEATGKTADISDVRGSARTIGDNLSKSEVVKTATDLSAAQKSAKEGSLVIGYWPGHVFTLNKQGMVNNVGAPRAKNNVFDPKYTEDKGQKFYIIQVK
jgi:RHS repeat-associated protein